MAEQISLPDEFHEDLNGLLERGLILSAWKKAKEIGPLANWRDGRDRRMAAQLASGTGAERLSSILDWKNWRANRASPEYYHYAIYARLRWSPPVKLLPEVDRWLSDPALKNDIEQYSDLLALKAWCLGTLKDFKPAEKVMSEALALRPKSSWLHVQNSNLFEMADRYQEALDAAEQAFAIAPVYRPAVLQLVDALIHLGRDDEAIDKLRKVVETTEQGKLAIRLQGLYSEREDHTNSLWSLDKAEELLPMAPDSTKKWLAGRRADCFYISGEIERALDYMDLSGSAFHKAFAKNLRLQDSISLKRKRLEVPFTRQHNMTCGPATLSSLTRYWGYEHDHLAIADAICLDGTPWHKERKWAESNGFIAREFRLTREILLTLIDRGLPFTLTTSWVTSGHLQACIGYDDRARTILIRDPTQRHYGEQMLDELLQQNAIFGPRCLLLVPENQSHQVENLHFPDASLYDSYHELSVALESHDRWSAELAVSTLRAINLEHPLTLAAEMKLAAYLGHHQKRLDAARRLSLKFPDSGYATHQELRALRELQDHTSARRLLEKAVQSNDCDPIFIGEYGELLLADARHLNLAGYFLRKAIRLQRSDGRTYYSMGSYYLKHGDFQKAATMRRYASSLSLTAEGYAEAYFENCRMLRLPEQGLDWLRARTTDFNGKRSEAWLTLARAHRALNQSKEARNVLDSAIARLPEDGDLKLQAAAMMMFWGESSRELALKWIDELRGKVPETDWIRHSARAAGFIGDRARAIRFWKSLLHHEPHALDAHRALARLIAEEKGNEEAFRFLKEATRLHPRQAGLWTLLAEWTESELPETALAALEQALLLDPDDLWTLRELAEKHHQAGDSEKALLMSREAVSRSPLSAESHGCLGRLLFLSNLRDEAIMSVKEAIRLRVDYTYGLNTLIRWADSPRESAEFLEFIHGEMSRQVTNGDCVINYQELSTGILTALEQLENLRKFCSERPDLWQTWSARITQCLAMDCFTEAEECAEHLKTNFPLMPRTWMEVARVKRASALHDEEAAALQTAVDLSPGWDWAIRQLGDVLERLGKYSAAEDVFRKALLQDPLNGPNHGSLASLLHAEGKESEAFGILLEASRLCPFYEWGWQSLARWGKDLERNGEVVAALEKTSERYAHLPRWWSIAADTWVELDRHEDGISAARKGLDLSPANSDLRDQLARLLGESERFDEAFAVCDEMVGDVPVPRNILGRKAWLYMESGQSNEAVRFMEKLLESETNYTWGWRQLTIWQVNRKDWKKSQASAFAWAKLDPENSVCHGYLGLIAAELNDQKTARRSFEKAYLLDPYYAYAGKRLFRIQLEEKDFVHAAQTLERLRHFTPGDSVESASVSLALARNDSSLAFELAEKFARSCTSSGSFTQLKEEFDTAHLSEKWRVCLEKIIAETPQAPAVLLTAWAKTHTTLPQLKKAASKLRKFTIPEPSRNAAWDELISSSHIDATHSLFDSWLRRNKKRFHQDGELWNTVGQILVTSNRRRRTIKWLSDWQNRPADTGAHTLVNLTAATDAISGPAVSEAIRQYGIRNFGLKDDNVLYLYAAQATYMAMSGRIAEACELLEKVDDSRISRYYCGLASLARSATEAAAGREDEAKRQYSDALDKLKSNAKNRATCTYFDGIQKELAKHLPWAARRPSRVVKEWGDLPGRDWSSRWNRGWRYAATILIMLVLALGSLAARNPILLVLGVIFFTRKKKW